MQNMRRMDQLYSTLINAQERVNSVENKEDLFAHICKDVLHITDIKMSWIGLIDEQTRKFTPVSFCGEGTAYLGGLEIDLSAESHSANGPTGVAFKEDKAFWCQDFLNDSRTALWHDEAKKFGWKSSAALPIHENNKVIGTLNLYSDKTNAFDEQTIFILTKLALHIDEVLKTIENEKRNKQAEQDLLESYNLLKTIVDTVPVRIFWKDKDLNYLGCNLAFAKDAGKNDPNEIIGKSDADMIWKDQANLYNQDDRDVIDSKIEKLGFEEPQTTPSGEIIWLRTSKVPLYNEQNESIGILGIYDDITEQKLAANALLESQQHLHAIIDNEPQCVKLIDPEGKLMEMNAAGLAILEADSVSQLQKHTLLKCVLPEYRPAFLNLHKQVMSGKSEILEFEVESLKGTRRWLETHAVPMHDADKNITMALGISRDITEQKLSQERIKFMANYDTLTRLPNRLKLEEHLEYIITSSKRHEWNFTLMFLDIDHFKNINDSLGHSIGDELLIQFGERLNKVLRHEDILARFGGDEFIILLPNTDVIQAQQVAEKLLSNIHNPFTFDSHKLTVTASIGIAIYPIDGEDKDTLYKHADIAMYKSKIDGRNNFSFFTEEMQESAKRNLELSNALFLGIKQNEFHLVYQPQISSSTGELIGMEALLRWHSTKYGNVSPAEFIPIAETNGLILEIGEWVLQTAVKQIKQWLSKQVKPLVMSVNLSPIQFKNSHLPKLVQDVLHKEGLAAECLELELTESAIMSNPQAAIDTMNALDAIGVKMSLDDFGTGYSSLSYLKKFKVYKLKIDQSFVRDISTDAEDRAIVATIINMAETLGLRTIAEGVETIEQLEYLKEQGCEEIQGYYYSKPLSVEDFEKKYF